MKRIKLIALILIFVVAFAGVSDAYIAYRNINTYIGINSDTKPTSRGVKTGSTFYETDTKSWYRYNGTSWIIVTGVSIAADVSINSTAAGVTASTDTTSVLCYGFDSVTFSFVLSKFSTITNALLEFSSDYENWFIVDDMTTSTQWTADGTYSLRTEDCANNQWVRFRVTYMATGLGGTGTPELAFDIRLYKQE